MPMSVIIESLLKEVFSWHITIQLVCADAYRGKLGDWLYLRITISLRLWADRDLDCGAQRLWTMNARLRPLRLWCTFHLFQLLKQVLRDYLSHFNPEFRPAGARQFQPLDLWSVRAVRPAFRLVAEMSRNVSEQ